MTSGQVFRPHFPSSLHPWLGGDKTGSTSWHSPFTKSNYPHTSTTSSAYSPSYTSSGLFSSFAKDENMTQEYQMNSAEELKSSMLSPLGACAKSGREGANFGGSGEASTPLIPSYASYPAALSSNPDFHNPYYPNAFNKALGYDKPKNKPRSSAGKNSIRMCFAEPSSLLP